MTESESIPVLTLHQPWASLVAVGVKTIETRSWKVSYRGPLAIHAAKSVEYEGWTVGEWKWDRGYDGRSILVRCWSGAAEGKGVETQPMSLGSIVATCTLVDVVPIIAPDQCEWHVEHPRSVGACAHAAIDGQVITHTPAGRYHTTVLMEEAYGDYRTPPEVDQRYAWLLADVVPVDPPVPFRGGQGLTKRWTPTTAVA